MTVIEQPCRHGINPDGCLICQTLPRVPDPFHDEYVAVLIQLTRIRDAKVAAYGTKRYEHHSEHFNRWMCFSDVFRKFIRLEKQTETATTEELIETYSDLANYAIMAIQLLSRKK